ncbi:hypothetical protein U91I_04006 [alpha proteobacterium U9-1i]|nr:hypothetical protein U91I_04006 [alpha proteobacterium U9-1i]
MAHAAVVGVHALCCGMPVLAMLAAGVSGVTSGTALLATTADAFHQLLHAHEVWILSLSAALVVIGGTLEVLARRNGPKPFPWLFGLSVACFAFNVFVILLHRGG